MSSVAASKIGSAISCSPEDQFEFPCRYLAEASRMRRAALTHYTHAHVPDWRCGVSGVDLGCLLASKHSSKQSNG